MMASFQTNYQSSWLTNKTDNFSHSGITHVIKRNNKFGHSHSFTK